VVDAPSSAKTTMQQRRSMFSLAYANESLGEFDAAKTMYQRVIDEAPDSIFAESAQRGLERASNPSFAKLYDDFASYKPAVEEAPGAVVPDAPDIDFPEIDLPKEEPADTSSSFVPEASSDAKMVKEVAKPATEVVPVTSEPVVVKEEGTVTEVVPDVVNEVEAATETVTESAGSAVTEMADGVKSGVEVVTEAAEGVVEGVKEAAGK